MCLRGARFPLTLSDGRIEVEAEDRESLADSCLEFTRQFFNIRDKPGIDLHPVAFTWVIQGNKRRGLCPHSWPTPSWMRACIEQVMADTSGMQPRFLYNDKPWLLQPAIYCDVVNVVQRAKKVADDWLDEHKDKPKGRSTHGL